MWLIILSLSPHNLHLLFCCILSILSLIWLVLMALFCAANRRDSVSLLACPHFIMWDIACKSFKMFVELFSFPFLFSGYFHSINPHVVSIVSGGSNQLSSMFSYLVFKLLYQCVNAVFNASKSSSSFFSWHI